MIKSILKKAYSLYPFKKLTFDLIKILWIPPKDISQHLYFDGFFDIEVNNGEKFKFLAHGTQIDNELYWYGLYGGWEKHSQKLWVKLCEDAEVILDVGANDGLYSLAARVANKQAKIISAEPLDFILDRFKKNVKENSITNIEILPFAFSNYIGDAEMYVPKGTDYIRSATVNDNLLSRPKDKIDVIKVRVDTVKKLFRRKENNQA